MLCQIAKSLEYVLKDKVIHLQSTLKQVTGQLHSSGTSSKPGNLDASEKKTHAQVGRPEPSKKTSKVGIPTAPRNLTLQNRADNSLLLQWEPSSVVESSNYAVTGYKVFVNGNAEGLVEGNDTWAIIEGLVYQTVYKFTVRAVSDVGESPDSNTVITQLINSPAVPGERHNKTDKDDDSPKRRDSKDSSSPGSRKSSRDSTGSTSSRRSSTSGKPGSKGQSKHKDEKEQSDAPEKTEVTKRRRSKDERRGSLGKKDSDPNMEIKTGTISSNEIKSDVDKDTRLENAEKMGRKGEEKVDMDVDKPTEMSEKKKTDSPEQSENKRPKKSGHDQKRKKSKEEKERTKARRNSRKEEKQSEEVPKKKRKDADTHETPVQKDIASSEVSPELETQHTDDVQSTNVDDSTVQKDAVEERLRQDSEDVQEDSSVMTYEVSQVTSHQTKESTQVSDGDTEGVEITDDKSEDVTDDTVKQREEDSSPVVQTLDNETPGVIRPTARPLPVPFHPTSNCILDNNAPVQISTVIETPFLGAKLLSRSSPNSKVNKKRRPSGSKTPSKSSHGKSPRESVSEPSSPTGTSSPAKPLGMSTSLPGSPSVETSVKRSPEKNEGSEKDEQKEVKRPYAGGFGAVLAEFFKEDENLVKDERKDEKHESIDENTLDTISSETETESIATVVEVIMNDRCDVVDTKSTDQEHLSGAGKQTQHGKLKSPEKIETDRENHIETKYVETFTIDKKDRGPLCGEPKKDVNKHKAEVADWVKGQQKQNATTSEHKMPEDTPESDMLTAELQTDQGKSASTDKCNMRKEVQENGMADEENRTDIDTGNSAAKKPVSPNKT
ncbi:uncharacterized protein LOC144433220 [Glandiceps talaboti]